MSKVKSNSLATELESKTCCVCKQVKPISHFSKDPRASDFHRRECKPCHSANCRKRVDRVKKEKDFYSQFMPI